VPNPRLHAGDVTNILPEKINGEFIIHTRHPHMSQLIGCRGIYQSRSKDFMTWSPPELVLAPDLADAPAVEYYGMSVVGRHQHWIGLIWYWHAHIDTIEVYLVHSRDGLNWSHPTPRGPFIASQYPWNRKWSSPASNGPIIVNEQMVFYFGGRWTAHDF